MTFSHDSDYAVLNAVALKKMATVAQVVDATDVEAAEVAPALARLAEAGAVAVVGDAALPTDEAIPLWTPLEAIPYHEMWEDDARWLPGMLEGRSFRGYFLFENDKMLSHRVDWDVL